ncbi:sulfite exporter TauE/SafE family protein [Egibacter rhizosphaerae]|uniref:Probable membrane transporter protein n=1 Tax=Egibacter rhizosphaerae TaxID=1670831 RepID=A0A411YI57_9ACTN|nr:sulfite exporter TauE/SafE family protein [Egibacter rhizosphaerae]QBI20903.1 sulfite exporter TauE/SafE family protein [Egibacter rhizosphaerae]
MTAAELLLVLAAIAVGSAIKGATGVGLPLLATPALALFVGVEEAVVVIALPNLATNTWLLVHHWRGRAEVSALGLLILAGLAGVAVGTVALTTVPERGLSLVLAALVIAYLALRWRRPDLRLSAEANRVLSPFVGAGSGLLQGATGISAPVVATYAHWLGLSRDGYVFTVAVLFQLFGVAHVLAIAAGGLYTSERLLAAGLALVPTLLALPVGMWLGARLGHRGFDRAVLGVLVLLAASLVVRAGWPA